MKKLVCIGGGEIPRYKNGELLPYETKEIDEKITIIKLQRKWHWFTHITAKAIIKN